MARHATLTPPTPDLLRTDELDLEGELSYPALLKAAGAYRDPKLGIVHKVPVGAPFRDGGRWIQNTKAYRVAMTAEDARNKTRATGDRYDYYEPGTTCDKGAKQGITCVMTGWVLGGRKFSSEHAHVTDFDAAVYDTVEVEAPTEEDDVSDEAPVLVEG